MKTIIDGAQPLDDERLVSAMKRLRLPLLFLLGLSLLGAAPANRAEIVFLFENRKVAVEVPAGMNFSSHKNDYGIVSVRLGHRRDRVSIEVAFMPDRTDRFATARNRKEFLFETFQDYLSASVEQAMHFEELEPRMGTGTFCVFTDASLTGRKKLPRGEYRHTTTGLKHWPGVVAVFTVFSNDTDSKEYQAVMGLLRQSVDEARADGSP